MSLVHGVLLAVCRLLCSGVSGVDSDLRSYVVRLGIIKAAHVILPRQDVLRQIMMSAAGPVFQPLGYTESCSDLATDTGPDSSTASDAPPPQV